MSCSQPHPNPGGVYWNLLFGKIASQWGCDGGSLLGWFWVDILTDDYGWD
jgi:hypothetical protein